MERTRGKLRLPAPLNLALVLMGSTTRHVIVDRLAWVIIAVTAVLGAVFVRVYGRGDFWELVVGDDQPIFGPLLGFVVYGSGAVFLGSAFGEDQPRSTPTLWGFGVSLLAALACLALLLSRSLHALYPSIS